MRLAQHSIHIDRTPADVFGFFVDFSQASRWRQFVRTMTPRQPGPVAAGSVIDVVFDVMGETQTYELTVLTCEPPSLWRHRTNETEFRGSVEYRFDPEHTGTRVTLTIDAKPIAIYGWLAMPLLLLRRRQTYVHQLPQLKAALESLHV